MQQTKNSLIFVFLLFGLFLSLTSPLQAQDIDHIEVEERPFERVKFYWKGKPLKRKFVRTLVSANPAAYPTFKKGTRQQTWADIISGVGGFLIGWEIGEVLSGGTANLTRLGIGLGITGLSIPIYSGGSKKVQSGITIFNDQRKNSFRLEKSSELKLSAGFGKHGL